MPCLRTKRCSKVWYVHRASGPHQMLRIGLKDSWVELTPAHMINTKAGIQQASEIEIGSLIKQASGSYTEVSRLL